jgi:ABC-type sugar transport system permease subunit
MYSNKMSSISDEIIESAHLDGAVGIKEFWYIDFPLIFPTFSTFYITGVVTLFTNQVNLFTFYGAGAPGTIQTFGYWMFARVQSAKTEVDYPVVSAMGLLQTIVAVPLTFFVKWLLEKLGPTTE